MTWLDTLLEPTNTFGVQVLKIIGIDVILAGDNAVVIALACRTLPQRQRTLGIVLGAATAVVLRIAFTLVIQQLLDISFLKVAGGFLLLWIAVKLLIAEEASEQTVRSGSSLWDTVRIIAIADMVMSLDNVLAIAAASGGDPFLIILGLVVSIPLVVGGATLITSLLVRYPVLIWAGAALLGWVAGGLIAAEPVLKPSLEALSGMTGLAGKNLMHLAEALGALLVIGLGLAIKRTAAANGESS